MQWKSFNTWFNERKGRITNWHRWFAWYPVRCKDGKTRWLTFIERKIRWYNRWREYGEWEHRKADTNEISQAAATDIAIIDDDGDY